jgi:hypothetical protein
MTLGLNFRFARQTGRNSSFLGKTPLAQFEVIWLILYPKKTGHWSIYGRTIVSWGRKPLNVTPIAEMR